MISAQITVWLLGKEGHEVTLFLNDYETYNIDGVEIGLCLRDITDSNSHGKG